MSVQKFICPYRNICPDMKDHSCETEGTVFYDNTMGVTNCIKHDIFEMKRNFDEYKNKQV